MITTLLLLHRIRHVGVYKFCTTVYYMLVAREPQFCIMTLCIITFWLLNFFMVVGLFIYMCKNCVCDEFTVNETNANLTCS